MARLRILSAVEQVAAHLRAEIARGALTGGMPGVGRLSGDLGVSTKTIIGALRQLEDEGLLEGQGSRRRRKIVSQKGMGPRPMRVSILLYEPADFLSPHVIRLQHALRNQGHSASFAGSSLTELRMDVGRVKRLVRRSEADAWIVAAGSEEILEWFCRQPTPAFALFGRRTSLPIASTGPNTVGAVTEATRRLVDLGHRRIVKLCRSERRKPRPGATEQAFLDELSAHGIPTGDYNLPDWEETTEGLHELLRSLFKFTPPTAVIVDEAPFFVSLQQFLGSQGLRVPGDVSLVCSESDPQFDWCTPQVAQIHWGYARIIRRILRWAATVSRGQRDERPTMVPAEFIPGGTIGPAPQGTAPVKQP